MTDQHFLTSALLALVVCQTIFLLAFLVLFSVYGSRPKKEIDDSIIEWRGKYQVLLNGEVTGETYTLKAAEWFLETHSKMTDKNAIICTTTDEYNLYTGSTLDYRGIK